MRKCPNPEGCSSVDENRIPEMYPDGRTVGGFPEWYVCQDCGYTFEWDGPEGRILREQGWREMGPANRYAMFSFMGVSNGCE